MTLVVIVDESTSLCYHESVRQLYYGDNLIVLRRYIQDELVDLVYLDPPFNSARNFNVLFREQSGEPAQAQIRAFSDTWRWSERAYVEFLDTCPNRQLIDLVSGLVKTLGRNDVTAYIVMMAPRLVELHRVLKPTGSIYLHCDTVAGHYLRMMMDVIFGVRNFRNEIIWKRQSAHSDAKYRFPDVTDIILFYAKSEQAPFRPQYTAHDPEYVEKFYRHDDGDGRGPYLLDNMASPHPRPRMMYEWMGFPCPAKGWRYQRETMQKLHDEGRIWYPRNPDGSFDYSRRPQLKRYLYEQEGSIITNVWTDIQPVHASAKEHLGYPTQKPLALLERIIQASSNEGDVVMDPFCGCGTAVVAAEKLHRGWIGIDITSLAITLIKERLSDMFSLEPKRDYEVIGEPVTEQDARQLALQNRDEFQKWAIGLVRPALPYKDRRGADRGVDGILYFRDDNGEPKRVVIQVKSGHVSVAQIRDFAHVMSREGAELGFFITLEEPTSVMKKEAEEVGFYTTPLGERKIQRLQIRTIRELLEGVCFELPQTAVLSGVPQAAATQRAPRQQRIEL